MNQQALDALLAALISQQKELQDLPFDINAPSKAYTVLDSCLLRDLGPELAIIRDVTGYSWQFIGDFLKEYVIEHPREFDRQEVDDLIRQINTALEDAQAILEGNK